MKTCVLAGLWLVWAGATASGQPRFSAEAVEEIQSLTVNVSVVGPGDGGRQARLLEDVMRQELDRADILFERGEPRGGDCCVLHLEIRLAQGAGRGRFGAGYTARLELGVEDRFGSLPAWTTIWAGRTLSNIVERAELTEALRFAARELVGDFIDLYRVHFPRR